MSNYSAKIDDATDLEMLRGIEGLSAVSYFPHLTNLYFLKNKNSFFPAEIDAPRWIG